jgi:polysaccharide biosynthesis/export protein
MTFLSAVSLAVSRPRPLFAAVPLLLGLSLAGCATPSKFDEFAEAKRIAHPEAIQLREGDVIRLTFPGAPNLNANQQIRRDGKVSLEQVGEVVVAGMTPREAEKELTRLYTGKLLNPEVTVSVVTSSFPVFVTGAVLRPGRVNSERRITALEAIMEAGGFDYSKANLRKVRVIRNNNDRVDHFTLNLKRTLEGQDTEAFFLKPSDIVYVPERFSWF